VKQGLSEGAHLGQLHQFFALAAYRRGMTRPRRIALPLAVLALLGGCAPSPEEMIESAERSFAAHEFTSARLNLVSALHDKPGDAAAVELLARTQIELGDGEAAMTALDRLAALGRLPADAPVLRGEAELLRGHPKEALVAVETHRTAEAWRVRALAQIALGDVSAAADAFERGATAEGPKAKLLAERARFALGRGDLAQARSLADAALAEDPAALEAQLASAQVASAAGQLGGALATYEKASAAWPESRPALIGRIATLGDLGRTSEMEPLLEEAAKRAPQDPAITYLRARLAAAKGEWAAARRLIQPMEQQLDRLPQARLLYGQALGELGQHEQARVHLATFVSMNPAHRMARRLLAEEQLAGGDAEAAIETISPLARRPQANPRELAVMAAAAREAGRPDAAAWAERAKFPAAEMLGGELAAADAALKREDWLTAARAYRRVLEASDGTNVLVLNNLAYAEGRLGNLDKGLQLARRALEQAPENASVLDTAGRLMVETGDRAGGLALLRKAARLAPDNPEIARHLAAAQRG
jgi:tetratricopeptide (TPR) repeat protein